MAGMLGSAAMSGAEGIVRGIVQKNFRKITDAVVKNLDRKK